MHEMTKSNLEASFAGESQAHMRYLVFADKAEREGFSNVARLFRAVAYAERIHATNHFKALKGLGETSENLQAAIDGETFEVEEMYPAYKSVAELQEEKRALRYMDFALEAEKVHADLYGKASDSVQAGGDVEFGEIHICEVCGWTVHGDAPDRCPLCNAKRERFKTF